MAKIVNIQRYPAITSWDRNKQNMDGDWIIGTDGGNKEGAISYKKLWDEAGCIPQGYGETISEEIEFNWNTNTKINNMSYLERMKEGQERDIKHYTRLIEEAKEKLAAIKVAVNPSNKELYAIMYNWERTNIGSTYSVTVPEGILLSPDQEEILKRYIYDIHGSRGEYGSTNNVTVEINMGRIFKERD